MKRNVRALLGVAALALLVAPVAMAASSEPAEAPPTSVDAQEAVRELEILRTAEVAPLTPGDALGEDHVGKRVRWAGGVYAIDGRCLTILFAHSGDHGEPRWTPEPTYQSFVACGPGVYDPDLVEAHANVTVIGEITGKQYIGMGGGGSDGPTVRIEKLHRWSDCLAGDESPVCKQGFLTAEPIAVDEG